MRISLLFLITIISPLSIFTQDYVLRSPNGKAEIRLRIADKIYYSIYYDQKAVVNDSAIALTVKEDPLVGLNPKVINKQEREIDRTVTCVVPEKTATDKRYF